MTSPDEWNHALQLLKTEMKELDTEEYLLTERKSQNVKGGFHLINSKRLEKFPAKSNSYDYFLAVYQESYDLFMLSALAAPRSLLKTFSGEMVRKLLIGFTT
jgi:hypothetical protein